jgi:hypothetical protein
LLAFSLSGGVAEAKRGPSSVSVCVDPVTAVVSQVSSSTKCLNGIQKWSASKLAPELCWNASSVDPKSQTRLVSIKPLAGCVAPLRSVPVGKLVLLCADQISGVLRWSVTNACEVGNANTWVRVGTLRNAASATTTTTTVALVPSVSLQATVIQGNTWPKAVTVSVNVAGTIYFVEGSVSVESVKDITSAHSMLWAQGAVTAANTPTSIALDVENLVNGYYRVFVMTAQGVLSAPATNIVTISVHPASQATTTTSTTSTTVAVRVQTLDQSHPTWSTNDGAINVSFSQSVGHSFTAGLTGPLSRIAVGIIKYRTVTKITASIYVANTAGNATGSALAAATIFEPAVPSITCCALTVFDFPSPVTVTARSKYVIVLTTPDYQQMVMVPPFGSTGGSYGWWVAGNTYAGGIGIANPLTSPQQSQDFAFQTYVDI